MAARVQRALALDADAAFAAFCDVESIPAWVEPVRSVTVVSRRGDGRPAEVAFVARGDTGDTVRYSLAYSYDLRGRRVMWQPRDNPLAAVRGVAAFEPAEAGCTMIYTIDIADRWAGDHAAARALAELVVDAFAGWLATTG